MVACKVDSGFMQTLLATQCSLHFDEHQKKNKFTAYIYIRVNHNLDKKSYISAQTETVKHLHAVFLLTAEHRHRPIHGLFLRH